MAVLSTIIGLAGTAASGIMSAINNRRMKSEQDAYYANERDRIDSEARARANENPMSNSRNRHLASEYDRKSKEQIETARNLGVVTGATPEYNLAVQKGVAEGRADLMGDISDRASDRADRILDARERELNVLNKAEHADESARLEARNNTYSALAMNAANAAASAFGGVGSKKDAIALDNAVIPEKQKQLDQKISSSLPSAPDLKKLAYGIKR